MKLGTTVRTAMGQAIEDTISTSALLQIFDGSPPANCAAADAGNKIAQGTLPSDWATLASGVLSKNGTWTVTGLTAAGAGTDGTYFRIKDNGDTVCHIQGTFGEGAEEMVADNSNIADGQVSTVQTFAITIGNA